MWLPKEVSFVDDVIKGRFVFYSTETESEQTE